MLHAVLRRCSYSVPREKRAATQGPIGEKRVLLGWAGAFSGALPFSSCLPPGLCVHLCLSGLGAAGSALFFRVLFLTGAYPRTELLSGIPMIYVWWAVLFLQFRFYPHLSRPISSDLTTYLPGCWCPSQSLWWHSSIVFHPACSS